MRSGSLSGFDRKVFLKKSGSLIFGAAFRSSEEVRSMSRALKKRYGRAKGDITAAQRARIEKSLDKMIRTPDGRILKTREWLDELRAKGGVVKTFSERQYNKEDAVRSQIERLYRNVPFGNPNHPDTKRFYEEKARLEASLTKERTGVMLDDRFFELNKTEMDYFMGVGKV